MFMMNWRINFRVFLLCVPICGLAFYIDFDDITSTSTDLSGDSVHNDVRRMPDGSPWGDDFGKMGRKMSRHFGQSSQHAFGQSAHYQFGNHSSLNGGRPYGGWDRASKTRRRTVNDLIRSNDILGPHFDTGMPTNFTVQSGKIAILSCRVLNRGDTRISWIRLHDLHILTVDKYKYSTDERVSVVHNFYNKEWVLRIKSASLSDAGKYECQISTKPVRSYVVNLSVIVPKADILSRPDIYVHKGSLINLTCIVDHGTNFPVFIMWFHHNKIVNIEDKRRSVEILPHKNGISISHLLISEAEKGDSGQYSCKPSNGEPSDVTLHILNGELRAAMQSNKASISVQQGGMVPSFISLMLAVCHYKNKIYFFSV